MSTSNTEKFVKARQFLLDHRTDYDKVIREFRWPEFDKFNWARDWFDVFAKGNKSTALWIKKENKPDIKLSYEELSYRSNQSASFFQKRLGCVSGDRMVLLYPNDVGIWEVILAAIKVGIVVVPTSTLATKEEIRDRVVRIGARFIVHDINSADKIPTDLKITRITCGDIIREHELFKGARAEEKDYIEADTNANDPLFLYFTSGTTSKAKLVQHTHQSYPVGHFSTMYWIGIKEGDIHQNISSPGWAKHAWSSFFAPFNAGATSFVHDYARFNAETTLRILKEVGVNTLCAPPTVWRMLILQSLGEKPEKLREIVSAGEPLNPEVIETVERAWGIQIRDGYGQTETTCQIGNSPGQKVRLGSMGRPLPGYSIALIDQNYNEAKEGELSIRLDPRPLGLMSGYMDDPEKTNLVMQKGHYRTGDEAFKDDDGYIFFVGRGDDVFKSSDYRISPFELESALIEHPMIAEAAVVPSPDDIRTSVPKAFIALKPGVDKNCETAKNILFFARDNLPPYKRIRKIEFMELPKTISGKIRRVELRKLEQERVARKMKGAFEYFLIDFSDK